jgi:hypothetical protein
MRIALIASIMLHVLFVLFSNHDLRATTHGKVMDVDIVPANEVPAAVEEPKADTESAPSKPQKTEPAPSKSQEPEAKPKTQISDPSVPQPPAKQSAAREQTTKPSQPPPPANTPSKANEPPPKSAEQPAPPASDRKPPQSPPDQIGNESQRPAGQAMSARDMAPDRLAAILGLPAEQPVAPAPAGFGRGPERLTKLTEGVKELKTQLNKCLVLPPGVARTDRVKMIMRIELARDGTLAGDPTVIDGAAPAIGYPLMLSAIRALRRCAPYHLPADKYADWQTLEIDFSPDEMSDN